MVEVPPAVRRSALDYAVDWTDAQWNRLLRIFPAGVCDYSKPGIGQQPLAGTWLHFN